MSGILTTGINQEIEQAAGDWLARRDSGEWSEVDEARFDDWLHQSPLHRVAYLRLEHIWDRSDRLRALSSGGRSSSPPPPGQWHFSDHAAIASPNDAADHLECESALGNIDLNISRAKGGRLIAVAASILLVAGALALYSVISTRNAYRTPVGGLSSVPLADGSKVTLNTDSEIRVSVTQTERRVELDQGEAFFEVAKDALRPFVVRVGARRVIAVGTKFSVRRGRGNTVDVVVTEGKVRIEGAPDPNADTLPLQPLPAGTVAQVSDAGMLVHTESLSEAEESLSWRQGILVFHRSTLAEAVAEFNRYNSRKVVLTDAQLGRLPVAGTFRADNVEGFVRLLERGYPLQVIQRKDEFSLEPR